MSVLGNSHGTVYPPGVEESNPKIQVKGTE